MAIKLVKKEGNINLTAPKGVNSNKYYTKEETDAKIQEVVDAIPEVDLSDYAKTEDVNAALSAKADKEHEHEQYLTEHQDLSEYAKLTDIPEVDLTGYAKLTDIPEVPSLEGYATTDYVDTAIAQFDVDLTGYATESYVQEQIEAIDVPDVDLSDYYTKEEIDALIAAGGGASYPASEGVDF